MTLTRHLAVLSFIATVLGSPTPASASDWTYSVLNPPGQSNALAFGLGPGNIVGMQGLSQFEHATLWTSPDPASAVDLNPAGAKQSAIIASSGSQHVGSVVINGIRRAAVWNGTTYKSLHLAGYSVTYAQGTDGVHQVGLGTTNAGEDRALLWSGSAGTAVVLNPPGSAHAAAYAIGGGRQVGWAKVNPDDWTLPVAGFWSGTAASWTRLGAPAGFHESDAFTISPDGQTQAGFASGGPFDTNRAVLWHSTPESFTLLHRAEWFNSSVLGVDNRFQVGWAVTSEPKCVASLWEGSAQAFTDLSKYVPANFTISQAYSVRSTQSDIWVAGYAYDGQAGTYNAILWHRSIPAPGAAALLFIACVCNARRPGRQIP